ncbi:MAG: hypothetical protein WC456_00275 [Patescibacteria group bacterium]
MDIQEFKYLLSTELNSAGIKNVLIKEDGITIIRGVVNVPNEEIQNFIDRYGDNPLPIEKLFVCVRVLQ